MCSPSFKSEIESVGYWLSDGKQVAHQMSNITSVKKVFQAMVVITLLQVGRVGYSSCCRCDTHASHEREQHRNLTKILDRVGMQAYHIRSSVAVENKCDIEVENETLTTRKDMSATMERGKENDWTHESKSSTLGLLLSTKLETIPTISMSRTKENGSTHCLQRFRVSCILYLHTLHSSLNTTFFVVFAYFHRRTISLQRQPKLCSPHTFLWKTGLV